MAWYQWQGETLILHCRLQPGASRDAVLGPYGADRLRISVQSPPVDGKANARLLSYMAKSFGIPVRQVQLLSGQHSRDKRLAITDPARLPNEWGILPKPV